MNLSNLVGTRFHARLLRWRNRVLADPAFQAFALRFAPMRPVARARAGRLFDLLAGFTYTQTLLACVESGLLQVLAEGPLTANHIATRVALPAEGAVRLLRAGAALGLAESVADGWMLGEQGAALLGNRGIAEMVRHHRLLYADLADPLALLRTGGGGGALQEYWRYAGAPGQGDAASVAGYSALMGASQPLVARHVLNAYPFARHRRVLDVGGGAGVFAGLLREDIPELEVALFDLPAVGAIATARDSAHHLTVHRGDFLRDPLPAGYDCITLVRIVHDHDDAPVRTLLAAVHAALPAGGRVVIAEPMAGTRGAEASGDAYFGMYLLAMGSGRPRRKDELAALLKDAGFARTREFRTALPLTVRVLAAVKLTSV